MGIISFLNAPYPFYSSSKEAQRLVWLISLFITFFCVIFQPFGIDNPRFGSVTLISIGFGLITLATCMLNMVLLPRLLPNLLPGSNWSVRKELLWVVYMLMAIALMNWLYTLLLYDKPQFDILSYLVVAAYTVIVGLMPALGVIFFKQSRSLKSKIEEVEGMLETTREGIAHLVAENGKDKISILRSDLLLISSAGNYTDIYFKDGEEVKKQLLRNKISNLEQALDGFPEIMRCHRKYIINTDKIQKVEGHSHGFKVRLFQFEDTVPVSKSYADQVSQVRIQGIS